VLCEALVGHVAVESRAASRRPERSHRLNFGGVPVDNAGVDQVSRPMQIALVAVVLLAGMWFTVLKPKPAAETATVTPVAVTPAPASSKPVAPGVKGLTSAIDKAKGASAVSDATNAKIQQATGSSPAASAPTAAKPAATKPAATKATPAASKGAKHTTPAKAKAKTTAAVKTGAKAAALAAATAKPAVASPTTAIKKPVDVDPSDRLLKVLDKGKTLVILFHGAGADDRGARKAVHRTAKADPKHVVSAYIPIGDVGKYEAITSDVQILASPSVLVIGTNGKATVLTGYVDATVVREAVSDARRAAAADAKAKTTK
jgi:hypothetical protein